jgi:hypothetical protein
LLSDYYWVVLREARKPRNERGYGLAWLWFVGNENYGIPYIFQCWYGIFHIEDGSKNISNKKSISNII